MGGDQDAFAAQKRGGDLVFPERQYALQSNFQVFAVRDDISGQVGIAAVVVRGERVFRIEQRRQGVVAAAPDVDLLVAVFFGGLFFVQTLQLAVVAFVQPPAFDLRHEQLVGFFQNDVAGFNRAGQDGSEGDVELVTFFLQFFTGGGGFGKPLLAQFHVAPACKQVFRVPFALSVADKYQFHVVCSNLRSVEGAIYNIFRLLLQSGQGDACSLSRLAAYCFAAHSPYPCNRNASKQIKGRLKILF